MYEKNSSMQLVNVIFLLFNFFMFGSWAEMNMKLTKILQLKDTSNKYVYF